MFRAGLYHGRILLDSDYPMKPPRVLFLTESGYPPTFFFFENDAVKARFWQV